FATLPPGTLNHTTASAASKVLKERSGLNVLVQPTAGDNVIVPMVGRGEAEIGITNIMEAQDGFDHGQKDLRIIASAHVLRTPFFVRKDSAMRTMADLKGKRVTMGYSACATSTSRRAPCWPPPGSPRPTSNRCWCPTWRAAPTTSCPVMPTCSTSRSAAPRCA